MIQINDDGVLRRIKRIHINHQGTLQEITRVDVNNTGQIRTVFNTSLPVYWTDNQSATTFNSALTSLGDDEIDYIVIRTNQAVIFAWDNNSLTNISFIEQIQSHTVEFEYNGDPGSSESFTLYINDTAVTVTIGKEEEEEEEND